MTHDHTVNDAGREDKSQAVALHFFQQLYGETASMGWITVWTLPDKATAWFPVDHLTDVAAYAASRAMTHEVYFGVGLRQRKLDKGRGEAVDVLAIPGLWFDIDIKHPAHKKTALPEHIETVCTLLSEAVPLCPSLLVDSGYGVHGYWLFRELWSFEDDAERTRAAHFLHRFQATIIAVGKRHGWTLDSTFSLAQVLRVPGTYNHKVVGEDREVIIQ